MQNAKSKILITKRRKKLNNDRFLQNSNRNF